MREGLEAHGFTNSRERKRVVLTNDLQSVISISLRGKVRDGERVRREHSRGAEKGGGGRIDWEP